MRDQSVPRLCLSRLSLSSQIATTAAPGTLLVAASLLYIYRHGYGGLQTTRTEPKLVSQETSTGC